MCFFTVVLHTLVLILRVSTTNDYLTSYSLDDLSTLFIDATSVYYHFQFYNATALPKYAHVQPPRINIYKADFLYRASRLLIFDIVQL